MEPFALPWEASWAAVAGWLGRRPHVRDASAWEPWSLLWTALVLVLASPPWQGVPTASAPSVASLREGQRAVRRSFEAAS
jgi:hypothetical protein